MPCAKGATTQSPTNCGIATYKDKKKDWPNYIPAMQWYINSDNNILLLEHPYWWPYTPKPSPSKPQVTDNLTIINDSLQHLQIYFNVVPDNTPASIPYCIGLPIMVGNMPHTFKLFPCYRGLYAINNISDPSRLP